MKIIHSFWTYPIRSKKDDQRNRTSGGWLDTKYHYMSWMLSNLLAKENYGSIDLYTDNFGKELLVDEIGLEYTNVYLALNDLENKYSPNLWAIGKMETYRLQEEPFLHIDGDVYLFERLKNITLEDGLVCQNLEINYPPNFENLELVRKSFDFIPEYFNLKEGEDLIAANAGIIGGHRVDLFKNYVNEAYDILRRNDLSEINNYPLNTIIEQFLFYQMHGHLGIKTLFGKTNNEYNLPNVQKWFLLPNIDIGNYIHQMSESKRVDFCCEQLEARLAFHYPVEYTELMRKLKEKSMLENQSERIERLFDSFKILEDNTYEEVLKKNLKLNPLFEIQGDKLIQKATGESLFQLIGINRIFKAFANEVSINDIVAHLYDETNPDSENLDRIIYSFVLNKVIYFDILRFV
ncbi:MAG: DUF6734 family protein [Bacteroidota bacterium]